MNTNKTSILLLLVMVGCSQQIYAAAEQEEVKAVSEHAVNYPMITEKDAQQIRFEHDLSQFRNTDYASRADIVRAFRKISKPWHPDKANSNDQGCPLHSGVGQVRDYTQYFQDFVNVRDAKLLQKAREEQQIRRDMHRVADDGIKEDL